MLLVVLGNDSTAPAGCGGVLRGAENEVLHGIRTCYLPSRRYLYVYTTPTHYARVCRSGTTLESQQRRELLLFFPISISSALRSLGGLVDLLVHTPFGIRFVRLYF